MSIADRNDERDQTAVVEGTGESVAESLKGLIAHIASQISEADQRHTEMLQQMQARLASLGDEARSIRDRVPGEYVPAFDRIEEGMQLLADRIATSHEGRDRVSAGTASATITDPSSHATPIAAGAAPETSAVTADGGDGIATAVEPWTQAEADALAEIYHPTSTGAERAPAGPAYDPADHDPMQTAMTGAHEIEREWLEDRFAEIARRVEQSLAEIRPESSFLALGRRFEAFEQRLGTVLEDVATRSDVEGLRLIEAHISELAQHLEQTHVQLERLDGIEAQLTAVAGRLADPTAGPTQAAGFGAAQIEEIVSLAAERVAREMAKGASAVGAGDYGTVAAQAAEAAITGFIADQRGMGLAATTGDDQVGLRQLVEGFIRERRTGDEQTAALLDTVQQAMIRVLDRIDAIEMQSQRFAVPAPTRDYAREQGRFAFDPREAAAGGAAMTLAATQLPQKAFDPAPVRDQESFGGLGSTAAPAWEATHGTAAATSLTMPASGREGAQPMSQAAGQPGARYGDGDPRTPKSSIERLRQDFVADAQRAKLRADAEAVTAIAAGETAAAGAAKPPASSAKPTAKAQTGKSGAARGGAKSPLAAMPIKKILVAALGLVIMFQSANLLLARRKSDAPKPAAANALPAAPKATKNAAPAALPATVAPVEGAMPDEQGADATGSDVHPPAKAPAAKSGMQRSEGGEAPFTGASERFVVPTRPLAPATVPETVIEDLNYGGEQRSVPADGRVATASASETGALPVGVSVQTSKRPLTPYDLARLRQQQQMASLSSKLGAAAAEATPIVAIPESLSAPAASAMGNVASTPPADRASQAKSALDLPPATVGPLSLRLAAAKGDPSAEFEVGARLAEGKGTDQSFKEAVKWYTRSANQGFAQAQYRLGTLYERGLGVKSDPARARVWYGRSAEQGNVKAMHNLAVLSAGSKASAPDYATAAHWFGEAATRGLADSQFNLAVLYDAGLGVGKDPGLAYLWFSLAARSGDKEAVRRRDEARSALPPAEAAAVDTRVAAWLPLTPDAMANDARAAGEAWKQRENAEAGEAG